jgi:hypothetical protein
LPEAHEDGGVSRPPSKPAPRRAKIDKAAVEIDVQTYAAFVGDLEQKITAARHRESSLLYWTIGRDIWAGRSAGGWVPR